MPKLNALDFSLPSSPVDSPERNVACLRSILTSPSIKCNKLCDVDARKQAVNHCNDDSSKNSSFFTSSSISTVPSNKCCLKEFCEDQNMCSNAYKSPLSSCRQNIYDISDILKGLLNNKILLHIVYVHQKVNVCN